MGSLPPAWAMGQEARRKNGFEWPWRKRQCLAVLIFGATAAAAACMLPLLAGAARWCFAVVFWLSWLALFASAFRAMQVDPVDPNVGCPLSASPVPGQPWCSICEACVRIDSKHCWECNKCVGNFDHHCPWMNTCIGTRNYGSFAVAVWALLLMLGSVVAAAAALLAKGGSGAYGLGERATTGLLVAVAALCFPLWCLDLSLVTFHCLLCWKGKTTYEFLTGKTRRPASPSARPEASPSKAAAPPDVGPRSVSGLTASSRTSVAELPRAVSEFMFGHPTPADPAEADPLETREAMRSAQGAGTGPEALQKAAI